MGMAYAARRGRMDVNSLRGSAKKLYWGDMTLKQLSEFAHTPRRTLPDRAKVAWVGKMIMGAGKAVGKSLIKKPIATIGTGVTAALYKKPVMDTLKVNAGNMLKKL